MLKYFIDDWYSDCYIMWDYLDQVNFYACSVRQAMSDVKIIDGGSMLYGLTWQGYLAPGRTRTPSDKFPKLYNTKCLDDNPELEFIFREFGDIYFPKHTWQQVQMNKNFLCKKHTDSTNITSSVLCTFGNFTGGKTMVEYPDELKSIDCSRGWVKFDGAKLPHWVEPFKGDRYSLVFFSNKSIEKKIKSEFKNLI